MPRFGPNNIVLEGMGRGGRDVSSYKVMEILNY